MPFKQESLIQQTNLKTSSLEELYKDIQNEDNLTSENDKPKENRAVPYGKKSPFMFIDLYPDKNDEKYFNENNQQLSNFIETINLKKEETYQTCLHKFLPAGATYSVVAKKNITKY